jgi:hypothetical protein
MDDASRNILVKAVTASCKEAACPVMSKGWEKHTRSIRFVCKRSRLYRTQRPASATSRPRQTLTQRPMNRHELCGFRFTISWSLVENCWILKGRNGCNQHTGHAINEQLVKATTATFSEVHNETNGSTDDTDSGEKDGFIANNPYLESPIAAAAEPCPPLQPIVPVLPTFHTNVPIPRPSVFQHLQPLFHEICHLAEHSPEAYEMAVQGMQDAVKKMRALASHGKT